MCQQLCTVPVMKNCLQHETSDIKSGCWVKVTDEPQKATAHNLVDHFVYLRETDWKSLMQGFQIVCRRSCSRCLYQMMIVRSKLSVYQRWRKINFILYFLLLASPHVMWRRQNAVSKLVMDHWVVVNILQYCIFALKTLSNPERPL